MTDYTGVVKLLTRLATSFAIIAFVSSICLEYRRYKKGGLTTPLIEELAKKVDLHFVKAGAAAGIPVGGALIYSAFDPDIVAHLSSMHAYIAIAGLILLLTCIRTLTR